jgi:hypothetical protein
MGELSLYGLSVRVSAKPEDDLVLIYADPVLEDLKRLVASEGDKLLELVQSLIWECSGNLVTFYHLPSMYTVFQ